MGGDEVLEKFAKISLYYLMERLWVQRGTIFVVICLSRCGT